METELTPKRYELLAPLLDERGLRLYAAAQSLALGYGVTPLVFQASWASRPTAGCKERLEAGEVPSHPRCL